MVMDSRFICMLFWLMVCVAEKDLVRDRGLFYKELLEKNGCSGVAEWWRRRMRTMFSICFYALFLFEKNGCCFYGSNTHS